jgi:transmembrane sensor
MTEAYEIRQPYGGIMEIEERAAMFLQRRRYWNWSEVDQVELNAWLAEALAHRVAFWRLEATLHRAERLAALHSSAREDAPSASLGKKRAMLTSVVVIVVLLVMVGVGTLLFLSTPDERTYATSVGDHKTVMLADGTRVEMDTDTVMRASGRSGERKIWLDKGEAYFQITHDVARPFIVMVGDHRVTDIGTKFLVRRDTERLEVAVLEGRVRFDAAGGPTQAKSSLLTAGEDVVATPNTVFVTSRPVQKIAEELGWRQGVIVFDHTTLADAAAEFNRYNRRKLVIADSAVANITIDGTFPTNDVEAFTDVVQHILRLHVDGYEDEIAISR